MSSTNNKKARQARPIKILGSIVNMVDIPFVTEWISTSISEFHASQPLNGDQGNGDQGIEQKAKQMLVTGFHGLNQANQNADYHQIGAECDLWVPDSIAPVLIAKKRGMEDVKRTTGVDILKAFLEQANEKNYKSYFYGDSEKTLALLSHKIQQDYPGHEIVGAFSPPFRELSAEEEQEHIDRINAAKPDILWVGLGLPKQDEWIHRCKDRLNVPVAAGVGAAFGFLAGTTPRAPKFVQKMGFEWAYMLIKKPRRTGRRILVDGSQFIFSVLKEELRGPSHPNRKLSNKIDKTPGK